MSGPALGPHFLTQGWPSFRFLTVDPYSRSLQYLTVSYSILQFVSVTSKASWISPTEAVFVDESLADWLRFVGPRRLRLQSKVGWQKAFSERLTVWTCN